MKTATCIRDFPAWDGEFIASGTTSSVNSIGTAGFEVGGGKQDSYFIQPALHPHFFMIEEVPDGPWRPKEGESFWVLTGSGDATSTRSYCAFTNTYLEHGNFFRTREEAESKIPAVRAALAGKSLKEVLADERAGLTCVIRDNERSGANYWVTTDKIIALILAAWEAK